jgi:hypothetical protein
MTMTEIQNLLTNLMNSIDKKTALRVEPCSEPDRAAVTVHLTRDRRNGLLQVNEADLTAASTSLMRRNHIRTALKRARDRMWEDTIPILSTKVDNQKSDGMSWARPSFGGRGRR